MVNGASGVDLHSAAFDEIHVPVLIIAGQKDNVIPPPLVRFLYNRLRTGGVDATLQFVPGGHAPITLHVYQVVQKWLLPYGFHLYIST